jgi:tRNA dimethylallyltransferase
VARALEVFEVVGKPMSRMHREHGFSESKFEALKIGLYLDRAILYDRIDRRVDSMVSEGFLKEVQDLIDRGFSSGVKSMKTIGYGQMIDFLERKLSWDEAVELLKRDTRRYAKRQMTWFRADAEIVWKKPSETEHMVRLIEDFLNRSHSG